MRTANAGKGFNSGGVMCKHRFLPFCSSVVFVKGFILRRLFIFQAKIRWDLGKKLKNYKTICDHVWEVWCNNVVIICARFVSFSCVPKLA